MTKEPIPLPFAMTASQEAVIVTLSTCHPRSLLFVDEIVLECKECDLSPKTVRTVIKYLFKNGLAEKPFGQRSGARLTPNGHVVAWNIRKSREEKGGHP